jgi:glycine cleavage system H protein
MKVPPAYMYTAEHEWLDVNGQIATVGITAFAAEALGDVVFVDLPKVGSGLRAGEVCGELESTKSVSDLYAPADGVVTEINEAVVQDPGMLNSDPFSSGWLFKLELVGAPDLLAAPAYEELLPDA